MPVNPAEIATPTLGVTTREAEVLDSSVGAPDDWFKKIFQVTVYVPGDGEPKLTRKSDVAGGGKGINAQFTMPSGRIESKVNESAELADNVGCGAAQLNG